MPVVLAVLVLVVAPALLAVQAVPAAVAIVLVILAVLVALVVQVVSVVPKSTKIYKVIMRSTRNHSKTTLFPRVPEGAGGSLRLSRSFLTMYCQHYRGRCLRTWHLRTCKTLGNS